MSQYTTLSQRLTAAWSVPSECIQKCWADEQRAQIPAGWCGLTLRGKALQKGLMVVSEKRSVQKQQQQLQGKSPLAPFGRI